MHPDINALNFNYSYTPSGDQPMGEQEMKIRGVHCCSLFKVAIMGGTGVSIMCAGICLILSIMFLLFKTV